MAEVGLLPFARTALQVATAVLPPYRSRFSSGSAIFAIVAQVAALDPDTAPKMPQPRTLTCNSRPGTFTNHGARPVNIPSEILERKMISAIHTKSGSAAKS